MSTTGRAFNFGPGPGMLLEGAMRKAQAEFLDFRGTGMGILEFTNLDATNDHPGEGRTVCQKMMLETEAKVRDCLQVPENFRVLFQWGGAVGQFSAVPLNLCENSAMKADFVDMGFWSKRAFAEAQKYCDAKVVAEISTKISGPTDWDIRKDAAFVHICLNETVEGLEFHDDPDWPAEFPPLVADATSTLLSRPIDVSKYGVIYSSGGKNLPAGIVLVIIREDLLTERKPNELCPQILDYRKNGGALQPKSSVFQSLPNTPPIFGAYMLGLVLDEIKDRWGSLEKVKEWAHKRVEKLYVAIENSEGFYSSKVEPGSRSVMNVPFRVGGPDGDMEMERKFASEAAEKGLHFLFGHPVRGGVRVTTYIGLADEAIDAVLEFMNEFRVKNRK